MFFKQNLCPLLSRIERRTPTAEITPDFMRGLCNKTEYVPVAQLDRVTDSDSVGRRFESFQARQQESPLPCGFGDFCFENLVGFLSGF